MVKVNSRVENGRELALIVLNKIDQERAYSNIQLNHAITQSNLSPQEVSLATEIVYGTLQRRGTLDWVINKLVGDDKKLEDWVRNLIRLSLYQLLFLERIPEHALVNEAVKIAKKHGHKGISGLVNGVLRNAIRNRASLLDFSILCANERLAIESSHPKWFVEKMESQFGTEQATELCFANLDRPFTVVRTNFLKVTRDDLLSKLRTELGPAAVVVESPLSKAGIRIMGSGNLTTTDLYKDGYYSIQDDSSMLVAEIVAPDPGMTVLDATAAPGGKTLYLAEIMRNQGRIVAADLHEHRVKLIREQAERLDITIVDTCVCDANTLKDNFKPIFDRILLDAPCSGLGVLRRKPELKWRVTEAEILELADLQLELLNNLAPLLKKGGSLIYSTCTLTVEENQAVIKAFLANNVNYQLDSRLGESISDQIIEKSELTPGMLQLLPQHFDSDGFFISKMVKS